MLACRLAFVDYSILGVPGNITWLTSAVVDIKYIDRRAVSAHLNNDKRLDADGRLNESDSI